jgi:hypothetical protein
VQTKHEPVRKAAVVAATDTVDASPLQIPTIKSKKNGEMECLSLEELTNFQARVLEYLNSRYPKDFSLFLTQMMDKWKGSYDAATPPDLRFNMLTNIFNAPNFGHLPEQLQRDIASCIRCIDLYQAKFTTDEKLYRDTLHAKGLVAFEEKFTRQKVKGYDGMESFKVGEKIISDFEINDVYDEAGNLVKDRLSLGVFKQGMDSRMGDHFEIKVNSEEYKALKDMQGSRIRGVVQITGIDNPNHMVMDNMFNYFGKIESLRSYQNDLSASFDVDSQRPGEPVTMSGTVVQVARTAAKNEFDEEKIGYNYIKDDAGNVYALPNRYASYPLSYDSGTLRNMESIGEPGLSVGDKVKVLATVVPIGKRPQPFQDFAPKGKKAHKVENVLYTQQIYLTEPSSARQKSYDGQRVTQNKNLETMKNAIAEHNYQAARDLYAQITGIFTTREEDERLAQIVASLPVTERPLQFKRLSYAKREENLSNYNLNFLTMNEEQALQKGHDILLKKIEPLAHPEKENPDPCPENEVLEALGYSNVNREKLGALLREAYEFRYKDAYKGEKTEFREHYISERIISYMAFSKLPADTNYAVDKVIEFAHDYMDDAKSGQEKRRGMDLYSMTQDLMYAAEYGNHDALKKRRAEIAKLMKDLEKAGKEDPEMRGLDYNLQNLARSLEAIDNPRKK